MSGHFAKTFATTQKTNGSNTTEESLRKERDMFQEDVEHLRLGSNAFSLLVVANSSPKPTRQSIRERRSAESSRDLCSCLNSLDTKKVGQKVCTMGPWTMESLSEERRVLIGLRAALQAFNACCVRARCSTMLNTPYPQKDDSFEWVWPRYGPKTMWLWYESHRHPYAINP